MGRLTVYDGHYAAGRNSTGDGSDGSSTVRPSPTVSPDPLEAPVSYGDEADLSGAQGWHGFVRASYSNPRFDSPSITSEPAIKRSFVRRLRRVFILGNFRTIRYFIRPRAKPHVKCGAVYAS
ncbi:hypothetical protein NM688_g3900 [Phlebia brevispora]|uniref:Uncharacterized protein n=1 Tax=Phlebia brevispora TaxID=194682 RepID=A0ACC1T4F1_9APHY|nr:hypothetical protein NM688_g3900 [Phlebia brevispora]